MDITYGPLVSERLTRRNNIYNIIKFIKDFFIKEGYLEVDTSILSPYYGGAEAKPFETKANYNNKNYSNNYYFLIILLLIKITQFDYYKILIFTNIISLTKLIQITICGLGSLEQLLYFFIVLIPTIFLSVSGSYIF